LSLGGHWGESGVIPSPRGQRKNKDARHREDKITLVMWGKHVKNEQGK